TLPEFNNAPDYGYTFLNYEFGDAGSGPYKVKRIEMNNRYEYERFEDYWGGPPELNLPKPYFKNIIYVVVNEDADGRFRLLRGDLHIASDFLADTIKALEKYKEVKTYQAEGTSPSGFGLWMHTKTGPLKDWRVRKAIKMALDYSSLDTVAGAGGAVTAQGFFLPGMPGWEENAKYFKGAQVEEANKLLDEAGYPVKEDGWRFHINLYLRPEPRWGLDFTRYGLLIRDQLAKIKINAIPIVLHVAEYYAHVFNPDEPMLWVQPWDTYIMPSLPIYLANYWGRPYAVEHFGFNEETQPEIADVIRRMRELHDQFGEAQTDEERFKILHEIERLNLEYGPWITIGVSTWHIGYNAELQNIFWGPSHLFPAVFYIRWAGS
ncbi:MAG: ABC transporter substrate-binding protein, partial [Candidatus Bathyarchaeia archaeon]